MAEYSTSVDIDAPREHVYGVLVADLEGRWWVGDKLRERVTYDPPRKASTPFSIDDWPAMVKLGFYRKEEA